MTVFGRLNNVALGFEKAAKPDAILTWEEVRASRSVTRGIHTAIIDLKDEIDEANQGDLKGVLSAHKHFEKHIHDTIANLSVLLKDTFIEAFKLRTALARQHHFIESIAPKLDKDQAFLKRIRYDDAADRKGFRNLMLKISNISTTAAQDVIR